MVKQSTASDSERSVSHYYINRALYCILDKIVYTTIPLVVQNNIQRMKVYEILFRNTTD